MKDYIPEVNTARMQQVIQAGQNFMEKNLPERTPLMSLLTEQMRYVSKFFWACQVLVLLAAAAAVIVLPPGFEYAERLISGISPFVCFLAVPEMTKDLYWDMSELENVCKNSSSTIFLIRLIIVGLANIFTLTGIAGIFAGAFEEVFVRIVICGMVPFVWENAMCLLLTKILPVKSRTGAVILCVIMAMAVASVSSSVLPLSPENPHMQIVWLASAAAGTALIAAEVKMILRERKEGVFLWN